MSRPSVDRIYVVVDDDGLLCNFADTREVARAMVHECVHSHKEPHRVIIYKRSRRARSGGADAS